MNASLSTVTVEKTLKLLKYLTLYLTLICQVQAAGVSGSLDDFFNDLGYHTNVSSPNAYKGQAANYYNGGSLYVRSPIKNAQLVSATVPSVSMGCGGIDAFMGDSVTSIQTNWFSLVKRSSQMRCRLPSI